MQRSLKLMMKSFERDAIVEILVKKVDIKRKSVKIIIIFKMVNNNTKSTPKSKIKS